MSSSPRLSDSYIISQYYLTQAKKSKEQEAKIRFVTISRQAGAGGVTIANKLAQYLQEHSSKMQQPWTVFDKNIVLKAIEEHGFPDTFRSVLKEKAISEIDDYLEDLFGLHPSKWTLVHRVSETILHLAQGGNVIIVGRGAGIITKALPGGLRVRLIGSYEKRVKHIEEYYHLNAEHAELFIKKQDRERKEYVRKYLDQDIEDLGLYDLIINTDNLTYEDTVRIIGQAVLSS